MGLMVAMGSLMWLALIILPWRPWSTRERLEPEEPVEGTDLSDVTALIPARNEELVIWLLLATTLIMLVGFWFPWVGLFSHQLPLRIVGLVGVSAMTLSYLPTLLYYRRSMVWALMLPFISSLYLLMTWSSALHYWRGQRSAWKGRVYVRE